MFLKDPKSKDHLEAIQAQTQYYAIFPRKAEDLNLDVLKEQLVTIITNETLLNNLNDLDINIEKLLEGTRKTLFLPEFKGKSFITQVLGAIAQLIGNLVSFVKHNSISNIAKKVRVATSGQKLAPLSQVLDTFIDSALQNANNAHLRQKKKTKVSLNRRLGDRLKYSLALLPAYTKAVKGIEWGPAIARELKKMGIGGTPTKAQTRAAKAAVANRVNKKFIQKWTNILSQHTSVFMQALLRAGRSQLTSQEIKLLSIQKAIQQNMSEHTKGLPKQIMQEIIKLSDLSPVQHEALVQVFMRAELYNVIDKTMDSQKLYDLLASRNDVVLDASILNTQRALKSQLLESFPTVVTKRDREELFRVTQDLTLALRDMQIYNGTRTTYAAVAPVNSLEIIYRITTVAQYLGKQIISTALKPKSLEKIIGQLTTLQALKELGYDTRSTLVNIFKNPALANTESSDFSDTAILIFADLARHSTDESVNAAQDNLAVRSGYVPSDKTNFRKVLKLFKISQESEAKKSGYVRIYHDEIEGMKGWAIYASSIQYATTLYGLLNTQSFTSKPTMDITDSIINDKKLNPNWEAGILDERYSKQLIYDHIDVINEQLDKMGALASGKKLLAASYDPTAPIKDVTITLSYNLVGDSRNKLQVANIKYNMSNQLRYSIYGANPLMEEALGATAYKNERIRKSLANAKNLLNYIRITHSKYVQELTDKGKLENNAVNIFEDKFRKKISYDTLPKALQRDLSRIATKDKKSGKRELYMDVHMMRQLFSTKNLNSSQRGWLKKLPPKGKLFVDASMRHFKDLMGIVPDGITVKNPHTSLGNAVSNLGVTSAESGKFWDSILQSTDVLLEILRARVTEKEIQTITEKLKSEVLTNLQNNRLKKRLRDLRLSFDESLASKHRTEGLDTSYYYISDGVGSVASNSLMEAQYNNIVNTLPKPIKVLLDTILIKHNTPIYQNLQELVSLLDFTSKVVLRREFVAQGMSETQAINRANDAFVYFSDNAPPELNYLIENRILLFLTFTLRAKAFFVRSLISNPLNWSFYLALQEVLGVDVPGLEDVSFLPVTFLDVYHVLTKIPLLTAVDSDTGYE
jgi:hypothetical protein